MAVASAVVLTTAACGNRTSQDDLDALLGDDRPSAEESTAPDSGTPGDAFEPAGEAEGTSGMETPDASAAATPGGGTAAPSASPSSPASKRTESGATRGNAPTARTGAAKPPDAPGGPTPPPEATPAPAPGKRAPADPGGAAQPVRCSGSEAEIVVGSVGTLSGVVGYLFAPGFRAVSAWAAEMNEKGGVNCHKVKHIVGDTGGDPARYQSLVRQFVEREGAIAFVFNADSFAAQAGADYLEQKGVPVIGGGGGEMFTYDKSMQFPVFAMGVPMQMNQLFQASRLWIPEGKTKIGTISCVEAEYCPIFDKTIAETAPKVGFEVVYRANVTLTAPNYTANCLEARNSGVQAFVTSLDGQTNQRFINSCANVGFEVPIVAASIQGTDDFKDNANLEGSLIGMNVRPWFSAHPAVVEHRAVFEKHIRDAIHGPAAINGWTTAKAFEAATRNLDPGQKVTSTDILSGLYAMDGDDLGGLTYPLRFAPDQPKKRIACGWPALIASKGKWTSPVEDYACVPGMEP